MVIRIPRPGQRADRTIAVREEREWWTPILQHRLPRSEVHVRGCRRRQDVLDTQPDVVIIDHAADLPATARDLLEVQSDAAHAFVIVVVPESLRPAEWRLRDWGAAAVVDDRIGGDQLAQLCRRSFALRSRWPMDP